ncbi:hypothetical protein [Streptococcus sp. DD13]|nr:hypothetical protein [Streptococcus sp. DD13]
MTKEARFLDFNQGNIMGCGNKHTQVVLMQYKTKNQETKKVVAS